MIRLGKQQIKILEILAEHPDSTILEVGRMFHGKTITPGGKEYNSVCRSLHALETNGYVERISGQIKWHSTSKA